MFPLQFVRHSEALNEVFVADFFGSVCGLGVYFVQTLLAQHMHVLIVFKSETGPH